MENLRSLPLALLNARPTRIVGVGLAIAASAYVAGEISQQQFTTSPQMPGRHTATPDAWRANCLPNSALRESSASAAEKSILFSVITGDFTNTYIKDNAELFVMNDRTWTKNGDVFCGKTTSSEPYPHAIPTLSHTVYKNGDTALSISLNGDQSTITLAVHSADKKQSPNNFTYDEALEKTQEIFGDVLVQYPYTDPTAPYEFGVHAPSGAIQTVIFSPQGIIEEKTKNLNH